MTGQRVAIVDETLEARIVERIELWYAEGADPAEDRPAHVRAGSGLAWWGDELVIVQDDVSFLALRSHDGRVRALSLPHSPGGRRRFEEALGNKKDKLDLESCVVVELDGASSVVAFGSGSLPPRQQVAVVDAAGARVVSAPGLYADIAASLGLELAELNLEGAFVRGDRLGLAHRGTGSATRPEARLSAIVELELDAFVRWLQQPEHTMPEPVSVCTYDLGARSGVAIGFTDVIAAGDRLVFLAVAEDTDNPVDDGTVTGVRIGVIDGDGVRHGPLLDERGRPTTDKAEGLIFDRTNPQLAWVTIDTDDPTRAAELWKTTLTGAGWSDTSG